jgi:hypothetical protein
MNSYPLSFKLRLIQKISQIKKTAQRHGASYANSLYVLVLPLSSSLLRAVSTSDHELEVGYFPLPTTDSGREAWWQDVRVVAWILQRRIWGVNEFSQKKWILCKKSRIKSNRKRTYG